MSTCVLCTIGYRTILYIQAKLLFPKLTERREKDCWWLGLEDNIFAEDTLILFWFQTKIKKEKKIPSGHCYDRLYLYFKVDEGGVKNLMADSWTTFLKARVMCGAGNTQQQYNNLKQAVVLTAQDKRAGVLYGLFSNAWWVWITRSCFFLIPDLVCPSLWGRDGNLSFTCKEILIL